MATVQVGVAISPVARAPASGGSGGASGVGDGGDGVLEQGRGRDGESMAPVTDGLVSSSGQGGNGGITGVAEADAERVIAPVNGSSCSSSQVVTTLSGVDAVEAVVITTLPQGAVSSSSDTTGEGLRSGSSHMTSMTESTLITPSGSMIDMEIGGLDIHVEHRALTEVRTIERVVEESTRTVEESTKALVLRLARGKALEVSEVERPAIALFVQRIESSTDTGISLADTVEGARLTNLLERLRKDSILGLALEEEFRDVE